MINSKLKTRVICIGNNKNKKVNINVKDCVIYEFIMKIKGFYLSLAKYFNIDLKFYDEKINSEIELDKILSILENVTP